MHYAVIALPDGRFRWEMSAGCPPRCIARGEADSHAEAVEAIEAARTNPLGTNQHGATGGG